MPRETKINTPCPECGRHDDGEWFTPCPSDDCPSNETPPKAAHTPGPWREKDGRIYGNEPSRDNEEVLVCDVAPNDEALTEFDLANARLIAAAPALVEALQTIGDAGERGPLSIADIHAIKTTARAALKLAGL